MRPSAKERFVQKISVVPHGGCWNWLAGHTDRYGMFWLDGKTIGAHRASYMLHVRPLGDAETIDHLCKNTRCVNPAHLEAVPIRTNVLRGDGPTAINARKTHCKRGHPFDETNTGHEPRGRFCKTCKNLLRRKGWKREVILPGSKPTRKPRKPRATP